MPFTALTRPRISGGVRNCTSAKRITTLTTSAAPMTASAASDRMRWVDSANTMIAAPNVPNHGEQHLADRQRQRPARQHDRHAKAPTPGAARRSPSPHGPVCRMSRAKIGNSARRRGEEHRAHVERDGAEDHPVAPDELEAAQQRLQAQRLGSRAARAPCGSWKMKLAPTHQNATASAVDRSGTERRRASRRGSGRRSARAWLEDANQAVAAGTTGRGTSAGMIATMVGISKARAGADQRHDDVDGQRIEPAHHACRARGSPPPPPRPTGRSAGSGGCRNGRRRGRRAASAATSARTARCRAARGRARCR